MEPAILKIRFHFFLVAIGWNSRNIKLHSYIFVIYSVQFNYYAILN